MTGFATDAGRGLVAPTRSHRKFTPDACETRDRGRVGLSPQVPGHARQKSIGAAVMSIVVTRYAGSEVLP